MLLPTLVGAVSDRPVRARSRLDGVRHDAGDKPDGHRRAISPRATAFTSRIDLAGLAIAGGLFIVPVFTAIQVWAGTDRRARVIAAVNVLNAAFMVVGALILAVLQKLGFGTPILFALLGAANLLVAVAIGFTMPASWLNDFLSIVFRAFFRLEVKGLENIDKAGHNAIIALNHVSFLDPPLAVSILPKRPVFAIDVAMSQRWWIQPFLKFVRTMALDPLKPFSLRAIINAVRDGNRLVIFPEGRITVTGSLMKVYDGAGMIADKADAMVVPVRIDGPEATIFSRLTNTQVRRRLFPKITVTILEPVKLKVDPDIKGRKRRQAAGAALYTIMSDLMYRTTPTDRTLVEALIEAAKTHGPNWLATEDPVSGQLTYKKLLIGVAVLGRKLMPLAAEGRALGVMLPTSNGAVVTMLAVSSAGRVPAMINFSAGAANILGACRAAQVDTILTSRTFVEKGRLDNLVAQLEKQVRIVYLEDIRKTIGSFDKLRGLLGWKKPLVARKPDDWAVILFTSGTEGLPKGVVLSHRNMITNVAQIAARIDFGREDRLFNALPVFHSFGFTGGVILPLISGVPIYLYPSPLHYRTVPELVYGWCATAMFGTDTFLNGYARMANPYDFRSLRYVLAGAEAVKDSTRQIYLEKFGLRILEGYGLTETSPVLALNTPMFNKFGSVGRLSARHGSAARQGRGRRRRRAALRARAERDARLSARRQTRRARTAARRLARFRRHRHHRRSGLHHHQGPRQALRQGRRRDGLACRSRNAGGGTMAEQHHGGVGRARSAQGRAPRHGHRQARRGALRLHRLRAQQARRRTDVPGRNHRARQNADARLRQGRSIGRSTNSCASRRRRRPRRRSNYFPRIASTRSTIAPASPR